MKKSERLKEKNVRHTIIDGEEYFYTTMPYHSSFYDECVLLKDLREQIQSTKKA